MTEEIKKTEENKDNKNEEVADEAVAQKTALDARAEGAKRSKAPFKKNVRRPRRKERAPRDFDSKIVAIRRVTRVVSGGRRFSFSVSLVAGDKKGSVGVGQGKASDTTLAIEKAMRQAKKNMITLSLTDGNSIPFEVRSKYTSSEVEIRPAAGRGLSAGSSVRAVLELGGVSDVSAKLLSRSKNQLNNARATVNALKSIGYKRFVASKESAERKPAPRRG
jgi:small subunit ribosomal protein S5